MQIIPRYPAAVQIETAGANVAGGNLREQLFPAGNRFDVPIAVRLLACVEFVDDVIYPVPKLRIARGLIHSGAGGNVMPQTVARQPARFPTAVILGLGLQAGFLEEQTQQTVWFKAKQEFGVQLHRMAEWAIEQTDISGFERHCPQCDGRRNLVVTN